VLGGRERSQPRLALLDPGQCPEQGQRLVGRNEAVASEAANACDLVKDGLDVLDGIALSRSYQQRHRGDDDKRQKGRLERRGWG